MRHRLWHTSPELVATAALMTAVLMGTGVGLLLDPRTITGAPAWLKPAKFAISIAVFTITLAWILTFLPDWPRLRRSVGAVTAATFLVEMLIIGGQAWRGVPSHFNVATPLDAALFATMGVAIAAQTLATAVVTLAVWRQPFADRALGWAIRAGLAISIAGACTGALMTQPTPAQLAGARTGRMTLSGAHTVGAPDGGPGLPLTRWSTQHGDLRVPHFIGLHAMQVLPLLALLLLRAGAGDRTRTLVVSVTAALIVAVFLATLMQALGGLPLVAISPPPVP